MSWFWQFVVAGLLSGLVGCASIAPVPEVTEVESRQVLTAWANLPSCRQDCRPALDARVSVSLKSPWRSGTITGYFQAMSPSYLKFVGVNPIGQPVLLLATDGELFQYVSVAERKVFQGKVDGRAFGRYIPGSAVPADGFFPFITGLIMNGDKDVLAISNDGQDRGYWLTIGDNGNPVSRVLFNPQDGLLYGHVLLDEAGDMLMEIIYSDYLAGECPLPSVIKISSDASSAIMELKIVEVASGAIFEAADFDFAVPEDFHRVEIE